MIKFVDLTPQEARLAEVALHPLRHLLSGVDAIRREKVAPAEAKAQGAPGNAKWDPQSRSIVLYDKGVYHGGKLDPVQFRRSIYHELAHAILQDHPHLLARWALATSGDGYVDEYAKTSPAEDFADSFSESILFPKEVSQRAPRKYAFIGRLITLSTEKTAMSHVLNAFAGEVIKLAFHIPGGALKALPKIGLGVLGVGAAGLGAEQFGEHRGEKQGFGEGVHQMEGGMSEAYRAGVQRGALAMRNAILAQMKAGDASEGK